MTSGVWVEDAALCSHQAGREPYGKTIAVGAEIQHMHARGHARRQCAYVVEELSCGNRLTESIADDGSAPMMSDERQRRHTLSATPQQRGAVPR